MLKGSLNILGVSLQIGAYLIESIGNYFSEVKHMKKAVIQTGGKQYLVSEGETLSVELIKGDNKRLVFEPLLIVDGDNTKVGSPLVAGGKVTAEVVQADVQADKVTSIRYKAKKRVHKLRGHRQHQTELKISSIA
jgi:large subunit ribosomal protein L21